MILFFARGKTDTDGFVQYCYSQYRAIMKDCGAELPSNVEIIRDRGGKPRFDFGGVHFSVSHSRGVVMVGLSHTEIGVDLEKIRPIDYSKFKFIGADSEEDFFVKWTERESYVKYTGEGLAAIKREAPSDAHFEHFPVFDGYHACVCAEEQSVIAYEVDPNGRI